MAPGRKAALRTRCLIRWPERVALLAMADLPVPCDRIIDGKEQSAFHDGQQEESNRDGFLYWNGDRLYGVKCCASRGS